jgi:hypothetical protein
MDYQVYSFYPLLIFVSKIWVKQTVQTLQQNRSKYFSVRKPHSSSINDIAVSLIQSTINKGNEQDKECHFHRHRTISNNDGKESPWLNYTGWKRQFADADMAKLVAMTRLELADEELWLKDVGCQVCKMIENAYLGTLLMDFADDRCVRL